MRIGGVCCLRIFEHLLVSQPNGKEWCEKLPSHDWLFVLTCFSTVPKKKFTPCRDRTGLHRLPHRMMDRHKSDSINQTLERAGRMERTYPILLIHPQKRDTCVNARVLLCALFDPTYHFFATVASAWFATMPCVVL